MDAGTGSQVDLSFVSESTWGTTPGTPSMQLLKYTSDSLNPSKELLENNTKRNDRQEGRARHGAESVGGSLDFNLCYGDYDSLLAAALFGTWSTASNPVLMAGTTLQSFSFEKRLTDLATPEYHVMTGMVPNNLRVDISPNSLVPCRLDFMGKGYTPNTATLGSPAAVSTNLPFDSFTGYVLEGASAATLLTMTSLSLDLSNNLEPLHPALTGTPNAAAIRGGKFRLTGTMTAFYESKTLLEKFLNETASALEFQLEDPSGNKLKYNMGRILYTGGNLDTNQETNIPLELPFRAEYDDTDGVAIKLTKISA
jgi:hypothetical protein